MVMQFSDDMLDKHAAPDFSKLISAHIPDLSPKTVGAEFWPARHLLVSTMDELTGKTVRSSMSWSELAEWVQDMIKSADDLMTPLGNWCRSR